MAVKFKAEAKNSARRNKVVKIDNLTKNSLFNFYVLHDYQKKAMVFGKRKGYKLCANRKKKSKKRQQQMQQVLVKH